MSCHICLFKLASHTPDGESMLVKYDWYIVPVLNPDGYEYSVSFDFEIVNFPFLAICILNVAKHFLNFIDNTII